ncbi:MULTISPECIES: hypothetical protein [unclassified Sphingomonas]|uniref:hypothetical protein n=1 Tax=unclassified Sphingomonas TaxID=196159 RepID=UPI0002884A8D|nr:MULTISPECIES: hypothetical protein [unclassified Sphingomonas]
MKYRLLLAATLLPLLAGGCVRTAASIVTFPVKAVGKTVDWTTTSQSEADRNYGKKMRKQEEREGRERKRAQKQCREERRGDC